MWTAVIVITAFLVLFLILGFTSPRYARVSRSVLIKSTPEQVFPQLNNLQNFVYNWSPWTERDPDMKVKFMPDVPEGVGAVYEWHGHPKKVGRGAMTILESVDNRSVKTLLAFTGRGLATAWMEIGEDADDGLVEVTWRFESDGKNNPGARLIGRMMDRFIGPDFQRGLERLKAHCEKG